MSERLNNQCCLYTMECYAAIKRNKLLYTATWIYLKGIMPNEKPILKWNYHVVPYIYIYAAAKSLQSCLTLGDPVDGSPPGSPVPGILQARTLERVAISFSSAWKWKVKVKSLSHVRLLATHIDCSPPGSSIHGILQAKILEWGAIAFSDIYIYIYIFFFFFMYI